MNPLLKGTLYILLGATMYGILASLVKIGHQHSIHTAVLSSSQFIVGWILLVLLTTGYTRRYKNRNVLQLNLKEKKRCILFGLSFGLTGAMYYKALETLSVSQGIILLMQSIWMSVVLESIIQKTWPSKVKLLGALGVLIGTTLVSNVIDSTHPIHIEGVIFGGLAAIAFTISLYTSAQVLPHKHTLIRTQYFVLGGTIATVLFWNMDLIHYGDFRLNDWWILCLLAICGTVGPPIVYSIGLPIVGLGIGGILSSLEIPITMLLSSLIVDEFISPLQWSGVGCMLVSVTVLNWARI